MAYIRIQHYSLYVWCYVGMPCIALPRASVARAYVVYELPFLYQEQGKNWRGGCGGWTHPEKHTTPTAKTEKRARGSDFNPPWHDSVVIHETETTTVTFNMQNMIRIVNILHISGHVLSTRRNSPRFFVYLL